MKGIMHHLVGIDYVVLIKFVFLYFASLAWKYLFMLCFGDFGGFASWKRYETPKVTSLHGWCHDVCIASANCVHNEIKKT